MCRKPQGIRWGFWALKWPQEPINKSLLIENQTPRKYILYTSSLRLVHSKPGRNCWFRGTTLWISNHIHSMEPPNSLVWLAMNRQCLLHFDLNIAWTGLENWLKLVLTVTWLVELSPQVWQCTRTLSTCAQMCYELTFWCGGASRGICLRELCGQTHAFVSLVNIVTFRHVCGFGIFWHKYTRVRTRRRTNCMRKGVAPLQTSWGRGVMQGDSRCRAAQSWWCQCVPIFRAIGVPLVWNEFPTLILLEKYSKVLFLKHLLSHPLSLPTSWCSTMFEGNHPNAKPALLEDVVFEFASCLLRRTGAKQCRWYIFC